MNDIGFFIMYLMSTISDLVNMCKSGKLNPTILLLIIIFTFVFIKGLGILVEYLNKKIENKDR